MNIASTRTRVLAVVAVVAIAAIWLLVNTPIISEDAQLVVSDVGSALFITGAGIVALRTALAFKRGEPMRRYWLPLAIGVLCTGLGDWLWMYFEVIRGLEPYPSLADAFYVAQYPFYAFGLISAALAYKALVDVKRPLLITAALSVLASAGVTFGLLLPYIIADPEETVAVKVLSSLYPLADILLAAAPAVFIALVVARLGGGRLALPWRAVALGLLLLAAADTLFSWMDWTGAYTAGGIVDLMWMGAFAVIAVGASLGRDVAMPVARRAASRRAA